MTKETHYSAYLIRWQDNGSQTPWRSTVEHAYTGQKQHFSNKSELLRFLWQALYEGEIANSSEILAQEEKRDGTVSISQRRSTHETNRDETIA